MAVAFDAITSSAIVQNDVLSGTNATTTLTLSASATMAILLLEASLSSGNSDTSISFSTVTLGGVTMTHVPSSKSQSGTSNHGFVDLYYLQNPSTGSQTLSLTITHSGTPGSVGNVLAHCISVTGALDASPLGTAKTDTGSGVSSLTITDTLAADDIFVGICCNGTAAPTVSTGTSRGSATGTTFTASHGGIVVATNAGSGSVSLVFATNSADSEGATGVKIIGATTPPPNLTLPIVRSALRLR